jgi:hypothetical protein
MSATEPEGTGLVRLPTVPEGLPGTSFVAGGAVGGIVGTSLAAVTTVGPVAPGTAVDGGGTVVGPLPTEGVTPLPIGSGVVVATPTPIVGELGAVLLSLLLLPEVTATAITAITATAATGHTHRGVLKSVLCNQFPPWRFMPGTHSGGGGGGGRTG